MPRRRRKKPDPVPAAPRRVVFHLGGRPVVEIAVDTGGLIVPGSVVWCRDPAGVGGPDRERAAAFVVKAAGLDPKLDHNRIFDALWEQAPKRG